MIEGDLKPKNELIGEITPTSNVVEGEISDKKTVSGDLNLTVFNNYMKLLNLPSINGVTLKGALTTEDLKIVGTSMTEIEVSTNPEAPTDILPYLEKSGTYVAKNTGVICLGELATPIAKGGFFTVQNFRETALQFGIEFPEEDNITMLSLFYYDGGTFEEVLVKRIGVDDFSFGIKLTTENASEYLDLDIDVTSEVEQLLTQVIHNGYGMTMMSGRYLTFISASNSEIDAASSAYRVITPSNIKYAIQKWGAEYYSTKQERQQLENNITTVNNNLSTLKTEIEAILESVVSIDE